MTSLNTGSAGSASLSARSAEWGPQGGVREVESAGRGPRGRIRRRCHIHSLPLPPSLSTYHLMVLLFSHTSFLSRLFPLCSSVCQLLTFYFFDMFSLYLRVFKIFLVKIIVYYILYIYFIIFIIKSMYLMIFTT